MQQNIPSVDHQPPTVAFYSIQGGVGKTTLARKFAELVTVAEGFGHKPNVLLIDLDVEASGLTFRMTQGLYVNLRTVHEMLAQRNVSTAQAVNVTGAVSLASGGNQPRGQLYLVPAAPPGAQGIFETIANIPRDELRNLLRDLITILVGMYQIDCIVIDCAPGSNPYSAAAATIAEYPFLVGRNEQATWDQIPRLPNRFQEHYPDFQPARQKVIINAVSVRELYEQRKVNYAVFDFIPLTGDVILETEGLSQIGSLRMLLFENYIVDIIKHTLVGRPHLIPAPHEVLGPEWIDMLAKLERCEDAPRVHRLNKIAHLRWVGGLSVLAGIGVVVAQRFSARVPTSLLNIGVSAAVIGIVLFAFGWYSYSESHRILKAASELVSGGPEMIMRKLKEGPSHRRMLDELRSLATTIPVRPRQPRGARKHG